MAENLMFDSWDHWLPPHVTRKWSAGSNPTIVPGRNGNGGQVGLPYSSLEVTFGPEYETMTVGFARKADKYGGVLAPIVNLRNRHNQIQNLLYDVGDGRIAVRAQKASTYVDSTPSAFVYNLNQWYYIEFSVTPGAASTGFEVRINETWQWSGSLTINNGADFDLATVYLGGPDGGNAVYDDFYATDGEFLGDLRIGVPRPNGEGYYLAWNPDSGTVHWIRVNEHDPDDDASYLETDTVGAKELHEYEDISVSGTIMGIQTLLCLKKTDAGSAEIVSLMRSEGQDYEGPTFYPSDYSYLYDRRAYRKSPFTGLDWTEEEFNALQFGLKRTV